MDLRLYFGTFWSTYWMLLKVLNNSPPWDKSFLITLFLILTTNTGLVEPSGRHWIGMEKGAWSQE